MQRTDHSLIELRHPVGDGSTSRHRWSRAWHMAWALPACGVVAAQPTSSATWAATALLAAAVLVLNVDRLVPRR